MVRIRPTIRSSPPCSGDLISSTAQCTRRRRAPGPRSEVPSRHTTPSFGHSAAITPRQGPVAGGLYPSVAYRWPTAGTQWRISVSEWNGTGWVDLGGPTVRPGVGSRAHPASRHQGGRLCPVQEQLPLLAGGGPRVERWRLEQARRALVRKGSTRAPAIAYAPNGDVLVACEWTARRPSVVQPSLDGPVWRQLGNHGKPSRSLGSQSASTVRSRSASSSTPELRLRRELRDLERDAMDAAGAHRQSRRLVSLGVDATETPVVAHENPTDVPQRIEVAWRVGPTWVSQPHESVGAGDSSAPLIAIDSGDLPVVSWTEGNLAFFEGVDWSRQILAARLEPGPPGPPI